MKKRKIDDRFWHFAQVDNTLDSIQWILDNAISDNTPLILINGQHHQLW